MKKGASIVVFLLCALAPARDANAGINVWTSSGPDGAIVTALAVDPITAGTVYAGTAGKGVFRSADGGGTWQPASDGLGDTYVEFVVIDPDQPATLYAASPNRGVFKSSDRGESWTAANAGLPSPSAHLLAFDAGSRSLYLSTNDGVFKSTDAANTWEATGLATRDGQVAFGDVSFNSWIDCLAVDPTDGAVYACFFSWAEQPGFGWTLLRSRDGGASWHGVALPTSGGPLAIAIDRNGVLHAASYDPVTAAYQVGTIGGGGWAPIHGVTAHCDASCRIYGLAVGESGTLYLATATGVYKSLFGYRLPFNTGLAGHMVTSVAVFPSDAAIVYAATSSGVFSIRQEVRGCDGDCDGDDVVSVSELVAMVDIALGGNAMAACGSADVDQDGAVAVNEILIAVERALMGCATGGLWW